MPGLKNGVPIALAFAFRQSVLSRTTDNGPNEEADALYLIEQLGKRGIAYLHMSEPDWAGVNRILMRSAKKYAPVSTVRLSAQVHTQ